MSTERDPQTGDALQDVDQGEQREAMTPGDEVPPGESSAGENLCRACNGSGERDGQTCDTCGGSGKVTEAVSGGA